MRPASVGHCTKNLLEIKTAPSRVLALKSFALVQKSSPTPPSPLRRVRICSHWITIQFLHQCDRYHETRTNRPTAWSP